MATPAEARPAPQPAVMSGAEKVAVLLLALGKGRADKLLKRFDPEELRQLSRSATDLRQITAGDLDVLVEEFAQNFSNGVNFSGTAAEIKELLAGVLDDDETDKASAEAASTEEAVWGRISKLKVDVLRAFLIKEHPQAVALILSRIAPDAAAKAISSFPPDYRSGLLCRMLAIRGVGPAALAIVELTLKEELLTTTASSSHTGIADILNRLEKAQSEAVLKNLSQVRPDDAKALRNLLFTFEDLVTLPPSVRTTVLDQVATDRLVLALNGTDPAFQTEILSALASRTRRMVEAELQGGSTAPARDIAEARRGIVGIVLKMMAKGEIELKAPDDLSDITV